MTEREKLIELIANKPQPYTYESFADYLLANGVKIPVWCKDCKHRGTDDCPMHYHGIEPNEDFLKAVDNDWCCYGE